MRQQGKSKHTLQTSSTPNVNPALPPTPDADSPTPAPPPTDTDSTWSQVESSLRLSTTRVFPSTVSTVDPSLQISKPVPQIPAAGASPQPCGAHQRAIFHLISRICLSFGTSRFVVDGLEMRSRRPALGRALMLLRTRRTSRWRSGRLTMLRFISKWWYLSLPLLPLSEEGEDWTIDTWGW